LLCEQVEVEERSSISPIVSVFSISPNPASGQILLRSNSEITTATRFTLHNVMGQRMLDLALAPKEASQMITTGHLPQGAYTWEVWAEGKRLESGRVVLIH